MIIRHNASMEDYLERIAMLAQEHGVVRVTQLSKALAVKKPSVTAALNKLSERELVNHEKYGYVELTAEGKRIAQDVFRRHEALRKFLVEILGVDPDTARKDACDMEHFISPVTTNRLAKFVEFVLTCPRKRPEWLKGFNYYFEHGKRGEDYLARCHREDK
ncbi:MAG TPA: metal-dependent transcriptional regulator [Dehalococcoidia bacterium]|nr:metal-dependent transcriptional regulator [Dehalococcoidia bacterium]